MVEYGNKTKDPILVLEEKGTSPHKFINSVNDFLKENKNYEISGNITTYGGYPDIFFTATFKRK